jgi:hypothetical protein
MAPSKKALYYAGGVAAGAYLLLRRLAKKRGVSVAAYVGVQRDLAALAITAEAEAQATNPLPSYEVGARCRRFGELLFLLSIERNRRFEVLEAEREFPGDADAIYRLHPLKHVRTQRQIAAKSEAEARADMMEKRMKADASPELTDLVLIGGGHSHVHVLRMLGTVWKSNLQPDFNVRVCECFDTSTSAVLRELAKSNRFVQKSAESTSM